MDGIDESIALKEKEAYLIVFLLCDFNYTVDFESAAKFKDENYKFIDNFAAKMKNCCRR